MVQSEEPETVGNNATEAEDLLLSFLPKDSREAAKPMLEGLLNTYFTSAGESEKENFVRELRAAKASYDDGDEEAIVQLGARFGVGKDAIMAMGVSPQQKVKAAEVEEIRTQVRGVTGSSQQSAKKDPRSVQ